jgi:hypothetical protein
VKKMDFKMSYIGIIVLIGALIAMASVFMDWAVAEFMGNKEGITGWDFYDEGKDAFDQYLYPMIILILGVVAIIMGILEFTGMGNTVTRVITLILGVLVIVFSYLTYSGYLDLFPAAMEEFIDMGYGIYLEFLAGIMLIVAPVLGLTGFLDE